MKALGLALALLLTSQSSMAKATLYKLGVGSDLQDLTDGARMQVNGQSRILFVPESSSSSVNKDFPYRVVVPVLLPGGKTDIVRLRAASLKDALALKELIEVKNVNIGFRPDLLGNFEYSIL